MHFEEVMTRMKFLSDPKALAGMARFGIRSENAWGISIPNLRKLARQIGKDHALAGRLWKSAVHEARILAGMIEDPAEVNADQLERWAKNFDSWDVCDQCCSNLFDKTAWAYPKAMEWSRRKEEFVKRAGFVLMACLAVHDKKATDQMFVRFLPVIHRESRDERNFVKKAVNWALRQIGKRNRNLNRLAVKTAQEIRKLDSPTARWIGANALRELSHPNLRKRWSR